MTQKICTWMMAAIMIQECYDSSLSNIDIFTFQL